MPSAEIIVPKKQIGTPRRSTPGLLVAFIIVACAFAIAGLVIFIDSPSRASGATSPGFPIFKSEVPKIQELTSGQITVPARNIWFTRFTVDQTMHNARVVGRFTVAGGSSYVEAVLTDEDGFGNWKNGLQAQVLYSTPKTSVGNINRAIGSGTYYLAFNNRFALLTNKYVSAEIGLRYVAKE